MLILLPPSETKSDGGSGAPLDLDRLSLPSLLPLRRTLADALVRLSDDLDASITALGLGPTQVDEIERNARLFTSPTTPALRRYTGVLYDALGASTFTRAGRARADARLWIGSALFGAVRASDPIPAYRLSGGSTIPGFGTLRSHWKPELSDAILAEDEGIVVDLRSGTYQQLGPVPGAITATVLTEKPDGSRSVVSHFNKHHKGLLARALTLTTAEPRDVKAVARVASKAGLRVEVASDTELIVLTE
ncbi:peroxide stress protein YaaA [Rhodococcus fascians]|nr:peroxide stress protein YaaA [Rhodococcus fascians]MBY3824633.1 peroxide stress protein YaaA [Rhodococcus fascians]MBY3835155.1 peroxide stress protein YaaA [Rhodococcus fascians]MBY3864367.1 peroxide stress protein YaaA [Rhodococcus fascians]MBY3883838.1 peroxide stress protein YaaA [Rhodococcus fascians]